MHTHSLSIWVHPACNGLGQRGLFNRSSLGVRGRTQTRTHTCMLTNTRTYRHVYTHCRANTVVYTHIPKSTYDYTHRHGNAYSVPMYLHVNSSWGCRFILGWTINFISTFILPPQIFSTLYCHHHILPQPDWLNTILTLGDLICMWSKWYSDNKGSCHDVIP